MELIVNAPFIQARSALQLSNASS